MKKTNKLNNLFFKKSSNKKIYGSQKEDLDTAIRKKRMYILIFTFIFMLLVIAGAVTLIIFTNQKIVDENNAKHLLMNAQILINKIDLNWFNNLT